MKKVLLIPALSILFFACNSKKEVTEDELKAQLTELRKQEADIKAEISSVETLLSAFDSTESGIAVSVLALKPEIFKNYIDVQGRVDADENITLSSEMPGTITKI